jgi:phosphoserine aminotransferase
MNRVVNFNAGPAALPQSVLEKARESILDVFGLGTGVMEIGHRSPEFGQILADLQARLRRLMHIPDNYHILFCAGGARTQFAMLPLNFLHRAAAYVDTGIWASGAIAEAALIGEIRVIATSKAQGYDHIPAFHSSMLKGDEDYLHITTNNTVFGTQWHQLPDCNGIPLVADMSSDIASDQIDLSCFDMIYAGAQKNLGAAGVTVVIIRDEFAQKARYSHLPSMFRYQTFISHNSLYNTPPVWNIYIVSLVAEWLEDMGGLVAIGHRNKAKAELLYSFLDQMPDFFHCPVRKADRSMMNIVFRLPSIDLEQRLVDEAKHSGFIGMKGHKLAGGIRISNYNAIPPEAISAFVDFLRDFAHR